MSVISEKYQSGLFPLSDDWQDDVRSSLYFQIWCSWVSDSGLVVWSPGNDSDDLGSIPGRVNFLKFQISIPLIFSHVQGYIYTHLDWNYHNHRGLVALSQSVELIVTSSTPDSEISGGRGDAQEPVGGWMMVHLKSQGTPRQDSVDFSGLLRHVICLREKKKSFGIQQRPAIWDIGRSFYLCWNP